jgi:5-methylcytosine-specific restriction endonuclease McrA
MKFALAPDNRNVNDEVLLQDLRRVAQELGRDYVSRDEYDRMGRFHSATLRNRFGNWNVSLERSGLRPRKHSHLPKGELLADLRRVATEMNTTVITVDDYRKFGRFSEGPFVRAFGGWVAALNEAGLRVSDRYHERLTHDTLLQNLEAVWIALGRQPRQEDMRLPPSTAGHSTYKRRYGSWRKALEAFVRYVNSPTEEEAQALASGTSSSADNATPLVSRSPSGNPRAPSWRLRFLVMRRDNFSCQFCGASPAQTPGVQLELDHVIPWSRGGDTILGNLRTLCRRCNGGKSDLLLEQNGPLASGS